MDTKQFFGRRALRILPAYYVALTLAAVLAMGPRTWDLVVADQATVPQLILHLFGLQTWFPGTLGTINGSLWSISLELHLYLVFPLLVAIWKRWGMAPLVFGSVALSVVWGWSSSLPVTGSLGFALGGGHALPARLLQFVFGMACAAAVVRGQGGRVSWWVTAAATLGLVAAVATTTDQPMVIKHVAWGLLGVALVMLACGLQLGGRTFDLSEEFGERAYSFYLLHQPVLLVMAPVVELLPGGWPIQLTVGGLVAFFLVTGLAAIMYRVVELPTHRLGRRLFPRPSPAVAPDQSQST